MAKTVLFVAAGAVALVVAFAMRPSTDVFNVDELIGTRLNQFEVDVAKRLKIVKFDQATATTREFEVAESDGLWSIPSKQGYPADAAQQMADAATCLIDRKVLRVAGKSANDHEALGVIAPGSSKLDSKAEGVGTRVTITDSNDATLADMIIGKAVKEEDGQYYVRNADQDVVYVVNLDPEKLSTKFEDWIEDDLLQLSPLDIRRVNIKDYSAELQPVLTQAGFSTQVLWDRRSDMTLEYDQDESTWLPEQMQKFDPAAKQMVPFELAEDEQLNEDKLGELRDGLDDLLLVDVKRKPAELSEGLKAGKDFLKNREVARDLMERGFAPLSLTPGGETEILSTEGEIVCTLKDGVEYVLRFGNLQVDSGGDDENQEPTSQDDSDPEAEQADSGDGINRYLFVMARFNESMIEQPDLAELPALPEEADAGETSPQDSEEDSDEDGEIATADDGEAAATEPGDSEDDTPEDDTPEDDTPEDGDPEAEAAADSEDAGAESTESDAVDSADETDDTAPDDQLDEIIAQRKSIEKENQRKLDEYQDQLKSGKERVAELNDRFGDWYYVISNDVYKKIHLSRDDVITKKAAAEDGGEAADAAAPPAGLPGLPNLPVGGAN